MYFVTGRPIRWMVEIKENFGFGTGICANGALLLRLGNTQRYLEVHSTMIKAALKPGIDITLKNA